MLVRVASGVLVVLLAACTTSSPTTSSVSPSATASPSTALANGASPASAATAPAATMTAAASRSTATSGPPQAQLTAEEGDPVMGQLGTYVWHGEGSDSPWLPGAPMAVGEREPLSMTFARPVDVTAWQARTVPAGADGPAGANAIGDGTGIPTFAAPTSGAWTLEVHVVFGDDAGDASYFWRLDVR